MKSVKMLHRPAVRVFIYLFCAAATALSAAVPHLTGMLFRSVDEYTLLAIAGMALIPLLCQSLIRRLTDRHTPQYVLPAILGWTAYAAAVTVLSVAAATDFAHPLTVCALSGILLLPQLMGIAGWALHRHLVGWRQEKNKA